MSIDYDKLKVAVVTGDVVKTYDEYDKGFRKLLSTNHFQSHVKALNFAEDFNERQRHAAERREGGHHA